MPVPKASTDATLAYPVQTADLLLWFCQRETAGRLSDEDALRLKSLRAIPGWDSGRDVEDFAKQGERWRELVKGSNGIT